MSSRATQKYFKRILFAVLATTIPAFALAAGDMPDTVLKASPSPWLGPVPKANCGPWDWTESGLQGQTTADERYSGDSEGGYNCNLEFVGQAQGEGAKDWMMAASEDCAYMPTNNNPLQEHLGVVVLDASNSSLPRVTSYLATQAMRDPHESLKVNDRRKLLAAVENTGFTNPPPLTTGFDVYDVSNCSQPQLLSTIPIPGILGHAGNFAPDGLTYYGTWTLQKGITPIDISDPTQPKVLGFIDQLTHDISFSPDGTRAYVAVIGNFPAAYPALVGSNGLAILDVSDFQMRRTNPQAKLISTLYWPDGGGAQQTFPVWFNGRPHLIFTDEGGSVAGGAQFSCSRGLPPHGFARIIDISDETKPKIIAKLMLEVDDPANCDSTALEPPDVGGAAPNYSSHYCRVDSVSNPKMMACTYQHAGLRVFDIRNPYRPREIAYYKPPAMRTAFLPGSNYWTATRDRTVEHTSSFARFHKVPADATHGRQMEIWFVSSDNGFQIVRFSDDFMSREKALFVRDAAYTEQE